MTLSHWEDVGEPDRISSQLGLEGRIGWLAGCQEQDGAAGRRREGEGADSSLGSEYGVGRRVPVP